MFYGEKLKELRHVNKLAPQSLAKILDVTHKDVTDYETGKALPSIGTLNRIQTYFDITPHFLFSPSFLPSNNAATSFFCHTQTSGLKNATATETTYYNYLTFFINYLNNTGDPMSNFPAQFISQINHLWRFEMTGSLSTRIEKIAELARKRLTISRNDTLLERLETSGFFIFKRETGSPAPGFSVLPTTGSPFIILGTALASTQNFELAHELAHLLLHGHLNVSKLSKQERQEIELEARLFAEAFLLPKNQLLNLFRKSFNHKYPRAFLKMALDFYVSVGEIESRALHLGLVSYDEDLVFQQQLSIDGLRSFDPTNFELESAYPYQGRDLLTTASNTKKITSQKLKNSFSINLDFLGKLFGASFAFSDIEPAKQTGQIVPIVSFKTIKKHIK